MIGVIPGPKEPIRTMNSFLHPLVFDLLELWKGVVMKTASGSSVLVRGALTCVACDIPAARKVCGFVGHSATLGCSKCLKQFTTKTFGEKIDYSGFDRTSWTPRQLDNHRYYAVLISTKMLQVGLRRWLLKEVTVADFLFCWSCHISIPLE